MGMNFREHSKVGVMDSFGCSTTSTLSKGIVSLLSFVCINVCTCDKAKGRYIYECSVLLWNNGKHIDSSTL